MDFSRIRNYLFLGLLAVVTFLLAIILRPFAYAIFWAAIIAALFHPVFLRFDKFFKHPNLSATVTLVVVLVVIILPLSIISTLLVREAIGLYGSFSGSGAQVNQSVQGLINAIKHNPLTAQFPVDEAWWTQKFSEGGQQIAAYAFEFVKSLTQNSLRFAAMFIVMLYTLFFFVRDGRKILHKLMYILPLGDKYEVMLYSKFTEAAGAIIKGALILGGIQASLGGITFWIAGIDGALIWSVVMLVASLIPGVGCALVWLPAGIIMLLTGHLWQGLFILGIGSLVISTIDNLLRPIIVGKDLNMPPLLVLFSTLGGVAVFGFSGFMIGPIIAALFLAFWGMYEQYYRADLKRN
jgi:predicted PurR-regulated permease PerM